MAATLKIPTIFTAIDKFTAPVRKMGSSVQSFAAKAEAGIARANRAFNRFTPSLSSVQKELLAFASAATVLSGIAATGNFIRDFETGLVAVGKTTGTSGPQLKQLGLDIITASNSLKTISSDKLLDLATVAGQLGVTGNDNIVKFSSTLAKLEKASDVVGEQGASSIARLLTITGEGVGVVDKFGASLVALGNTSAATEGEILGVASEVARATAAYKLQSHEILGISTALKSLDVAPEAAGSAILEVFRGLEMATLKGGKQLSAYSKIMGVSQAEVKKQFAESPKQAFATFIQGLNRISNEGGSVAQSLDSVGLSGKIVSKAIVPLATNFSLLKEKMDTAEKGFKDNAALNQEFAASQNTINAAIDSLVRKWNNLFTEQAIAGSGLDDIRGIIVKVTDNLETIVKWGGILVGVWIAMKVALLAAQGAMLLYNIGLGITGALSGTASIAIGKNTAALVAYKVTTALASAATWAFGAALSIGLWPLTLIALAIAAVIAVTVIVIKKWDEWGAALSLFLGPLGLVISLIQSFRRNWDMVKQAFKDGGLLGAIKAIGVVIFDAILMPIQQLLTIMSNIPGKIGEMASAGASKIEAFRADLGVQTQPVQAVNPEAERQAALQETVSTQRQNVSIGIEDKTGRATVESDNDFVPINLNRTWIPT